jgi:hypothetical protein
MTVACPSEFSDITYGVYGDILFFISRKASFAKFNYSGSYCLLERLEVFTDWSWIGKLLFFTMNADYLFCTKIGVLLGSAFI